MLLWLGKVPICVASIYREVGRYRKDTSYKTIILPVLTFVSETWTLTKTDEIILATFERNILKKRLETEVQHEQRRQVKTYVQL